MKKGVLVVALSLFTACRARQEAPEARPAAPGPVRNELCRLLSDQEASDIMGIKLARAPIRTPGICAYGFADIATSKIVDVKFRVESGTALFENERQRGREDVPSPVIGDRAFSRSTWRDAIVGVVKGNRSLLVIVDDHSEPPRPRETMVQQAVAMARRILERM
jgi:hypothetical protein